MTFGNAMKTLTGTILRLTPHAANEPELDQMEQAFDDVGKEIAKMHRQLLVEEHNHAAIQARYTQMMGAAEHLKQQIAANPPNKAELEASFAKLTDQIEKIAAGLDDDKRYVEETRTLLADLEAAYQEKAQALAESKADLQRAKADLQRLKQ
jgi:chromosome segregation ATPase